MALLYDQFGNPVRAMDAVGGDTLTDSRTLTQNLVAVNGEIDIDCEGEHTGAAQVTGTFVATAIAEASYDGTNYFQVPLFNPLTEVYVVSITTVGQFEFDIPAGSKRVRLRCSAYTSGTMTVAMRASKAMDFVYAKDLPATNTVTVTAAISTGATLTLPAAGAGLYNYLVGLYIVKFAGALLTAAATPVLVTTTGITGSPVFSFSAGADAQGTVEKQQFEPVKPLKGSAANTALTVVAPVVTSVIWRLNAIYYIGA